MNVRGTRNLPSFTLIDSFVNNKLQPFTTYQVRNSKNQFLSYKKLRRYLPRQNFIGQSKIKKSHTFNNQTPKSMFRLSDSISTTKLIPIKSKSTGYAKIYRKYLHKKFRTITNIKRKKTNV